MKLGNLAAIFAGLTLSVTATNAVAQDEIRLKFSSVFPANHWTWEKGGSVFADRVGELTDGRVQFDLFPAAQLGKESVGLLRSGLAETAILVPSYEPAKLPMTSVAELPGYYDSSCEGTAKLWHILEDGGALYEAEYKPQGLIPLYVNVLPPFQLVTATKQVKTIEDAAGLKLRANGTAMTKTANQLDAVPVSVTTTEFYDSLSRGTVDGGVYYMGSVKNVGLDGVIRYSLAGTRLGGGATVYAMNQKSWDSLDDEAQRALREAGQQLQQQLCAQLDELNQQVVDELVSAGSLTVTSATEEERDRWQEVLTPVSKEWAGQLEQSGRPGQAVLDAFRAAPAQF